MDTQQKVLAAYQIEHKEHLEGVRALLTELADNGGSDVQPRLEEAFRRVHSLKGGARVCGLQPVETIAHRLESHFSQLRLGTLPLDRSTIVVANEALDAIEDCMAALTENPAPPQSAPESPAADSPVGRLSRPSAAHEFALRILAAFQAEHRDYLVGLRSMLERAIVRGETLAPVDVEEALRLAHSLHGAARVAGIETVERIGQTLESQWSQIRDRTLELDPDLGRRMGALLAEVEQHMAALAKPGGPLVADRADGESGRPAPEAGRERCTPAATAAVADAARESTAEVAVEVAAEAPPRTPAIPLADTVRVSAESLDQLLRSSSQLVAEAAHQDQIARELRQFERQLDDLERQRAAVRKGVAQALRRIESDSHGNRLDQYLDAMERQVQALSAGARRIQRLHRSGAWLTKARSQQIHDDVRRTRMAPAESVFQGFRKMVRDLAKDEGKQVEFRITGYEVPADRMVLQALKDPLMHMLCNAVIHGIESPDERRARGKNEVGRISLKIEALGHRLCVTIEDDGRGIDRHRVGEIAVEAGLLSPIEAAACGPDEIAALVFRPGLSTAAAITTLSGRGMGLSVVHESVARLQGDVQVRSNEEPGATFVVSVPLSVSTHHLLLIACRGETFGIPVHGIECLLRMKIGEVETVEGKPIVNFRSRPIPLVGLAQLLNIAETDFHVVGDALPVVILRSGTRQLGIGVDAFVAEGEYLIDEFTGPAATNGKFVGGVIMDNGQVALVLHPGELLKSLKPKQRIPAIQLAPPSIAKQAATILVVDDSFTTRTLEKSILETHGYRVRVAVDGMEALAQLGSGHVDLVISDVQMPRLDGFGLLERIKSDERLKTTPVILVTSMEGREDQERGLALGAKAYIVKRKFDHQELLKTIEQIL